ncbi:MAG TPA: biopolymer transporter ExbD [Methylomirabilota bacterium]|nr:biopolymer transporter ExbD [Methylomirabilota bacterium]
MPVKLGSKLTPETEARIEIIPLIDIMFFLLAAFMLVSLSMVKLKAVPLNLPTATTAASDSDPNLLSISVDPAGLAYLDRQPIGHNELVLSLAARHQTNDNLRVLLSGDADARHGDIIRVLDLIRSAGIRNVAFEIGEPPASERHPIAAP